MRRLPLLLATVLAVVCLSVPAFAKPTTGGHAPRAKTAAPASKKAHAAPKAHAHTQPAKAKHAPARKGKHGPTARLRPAKKTG